MPDKPITHLEFLAKFPTLRRQPVYAVVGSDTFNSEIVVKTILEKYETAGASDFDSAVLHSDSDAVATAIDHLETMPFLAKYKIVVVKEFDKYSAKETEPFKSYLQNPASTSILIITAEKLDARTVFYKTLIKSGTVIECKPPYSANDILRWLRVEISKQNIKMEAEAQQYFANSIEMDYRIAAMELEKVILYTKNAGFIRLSDVRNCIGISKKNKIFDLQNALGSKNTTLALQVLENLIAHEDTSKIGVFTTVMLTRFFTTIWKVHACRDRNLSDQEITNHHLPEVFFSFRRDYLKYAGNYNQAALRKVFSLLLQTDIDLKSLGVRPEILLEMLIYKIIQAGKEYAVS
jgi:DNA polymerase III subunit delta